MMSAIGQEPSPDPRTGAQQRRAGQPTVGARIFAALTQIMLEPGPMPTARSGDRRFDAAGSFNCHDVSALSLAITSPARMARSCEELAARSRSWRRGRGSDGRAGGPVPGSSARPASTPLGRGRAINTY
jgi:hypothetical protein